MCTTTHSCLNSYGRFWLFSYLCTIRDGSGQNPTWGHFGQPDPNNFSMNPSNPRYNFVQPERPESNNMVICHALLHHFCMHYSTIHESPTPCNFFVKFGQNWLTNVKKTWPELDPNQILLTSQKQKPDPRTKKRTRPIPNTSSLTRWSFIYDLTYHFLPWFTLTYGKYFNLWPD